MIHNQKFNKRRLICRQLGKVIKWSLSLSIIFNLASCQFEIRNLPQEVATKGRLAKSPSGQYNLKIVSLKNNDGPLEKFKILDSKGQVVYESSEEFYIRHTTYFLWDQQERVWVYSGDLGTFFWEINPQTNKWERHTYGPYGGNNVSAPKFLKKTRPKSHQQ